NNFKLNYLPASGYLLSADNSLGIVNSAVDQIGLEQWYPTRNDAGKLTNYEAVGRIATNQPPVVTVSAIGLAAGAAITNNGLMFGPDTPGTLTSGIQEALNSMATPTNVIGYRTNNGVISRITSDAGGGILQLGKGTFVCTAPIVLPSTNPVNLRIEGAGMINT